MGEIGGNDYNNPLLAGKSIEQVQTYVPLVIEEISSTIKVWIWKARITDRCYKSTKSFSNFGVFIALQELIELGAVTLLVPGNFPIGCLAIYLTKFQTSDETQYDSLTGCLNWLNKFAEYHNDQLKIELSQIRRLHPHVNIIYADYYNAMMHFYHSPYQYGTSNLLMWDNIFSILIV